MTTKSPKIKMADTTLRLQKWIQLGHVCELANFWLSSHNSGKAAVIHKRVLYGAAMVTPYKTLFNFGNIEIFELQLLRRDDDQKAKNWQVD